MSAPAPAESVTAVQTDKAIATTVRCVNIALPPRPLAAHATEILNRSAAAQRSRDKRENSMPGERSPPPGTARTPTQEPGPPELHRNPAPPPISRSADQRSTSIKPHPWTETEVLVPVRLSAYSGPWSKRPRRVPVCYRIQ